MKLILFRHGESVSCTLAATSRLPNDGDNGLTMNGQKQVRAFVRELQALTGRSETIHLYSSPLLRARESATIIEAELGASAIVVDALRERDFEFPEGCSMEESRRLQLAAHRRPSDRIAGESVAEHRCRVAHWIDKVLSTQPLPDIAIVVSHGGTIEQLHMHLLSSPVEASSRVFSALSPGCFHEWSVLRESDGEPVLRADRIDARPTFEH